MDPAVPRHGTRARTGADLASPESDGDTAVVLEAPGGRRRRHWGRPLALATVVVAATSAMALGAGRSSGDVALATAGAPSPTAASVPVVTTSTTLATCRNSAAPACGGFRFDPQPGPDRPMTVDVAVVPASPRAGEEMTFRVILTDPDGVSYGTSTFSFGDAGLAGSPLPPCDKFGPWDPPARGATATSVAEDVRHTYARAGTYTATFSFDAGPFACVDGLTGRGDRPYASSATASVTVVVV